MRRPWYSGAAARGGGNHAQSPEAQDYDSGREHVLARGHRRRAGTESSRGGRRAPILVPVSNADFLGIDLKSIDAIILSHGHYDHTGGLAAVLARVGGEVRVVAHPSVFDARYSRGPTPDRCRYTGIPNRREVLETLGARFELAASPTWLTDDIVSSGEEPMTTDFEAVTPGVFRQACHGTYEPDSIADDQSLYLRTDLGLVVLLGCAHRGAINIIRHAQKLTGTAEVYLVAGGTHLGPAPEHQIAARLDAQLGGRFFFNNAGGVITLPIGD